jgi:hypothetical protein
MPNRVKIAPQDHGKWSRHGKSSSSGQTAIVKRTGTMPAK